MNIYNKLPEELQNKIDSGIQSNIKDFVTNDVFEELEQFHKRRLRLLIFDYYRQFKKKHRFFVGWIGIEESILMWLNHPYSQNMDDPFMHGQVTNRFVRVMKRIYPLGVYNETQYRYATTFYTKQQIVEKILSVLTVKELEKLYIYKVRWIGCCTQKHIIPVPLGEQCHI